MNLIKTIAGILLGTLLVALIVFISRGTSVELLFKPNIVKTGVLYIILTGAMWLFISFFLPYLNPLLKTLFIKSIKNWNIRKSLINIFTFLLLILSWGTALLGLSFWLKTGWDYFGYGLKSIGIVLCGISYIIFFVYIHRERL
jgi:hypothetical protein